MDAQQVDLINTVYEASVDPYALDRFVQELSQKTGSAAGSIYCRERGAKTESFLSCYGVPPEQLAAYAEISQFERGFCRYLPAEPTVGTIAYTQDTLPKGRLHAANIYNSFLEPQGLAQANFMFIERDATQSLSASFMRARAHGEFDGQHKSLFREVMPHLQRSFRLKKRTNDMKLHQSQAWQMLELMPYGVIVFSNQQKVMYVNKTAADITCTNDGLRLSSAELSAQGSTENKKLRDLLKSTITSTIDPLTHMSGGDMLISRPSGKRAYSVMVNPISAKASAGWIYPAAIVIVHDHNREVEASIERMQILYGLTPTESRVANQMLLGKSLDQCAQNLGHSVSTSRNLLKRVFGKTNTRRQNELVSLLLRSPLSLVRQDP